MRSARPAGRSPLYSALFATDARDRYFRDWDRCCERSGTVLCFEAPTRSSPQIGLSFLIRTVINFSFKSYKQVRVFRCLWQRCLYPTLPLRILCKVCYLLIRVILVVLRNEFAIAGRIYLLLCQKSVYFWLFNILYDFWLGPTQLSAM